MKIIKKYFCFDSLQYYINIFDSRPSLKQDSRQERSGSITNSLGGSGGAGAGSGGPTSFQDFQESVDDAWDSGDDEFCLVSDVKISKKVSHSAALSVINHHRSSTTGALPQVNSKESNRQEIISEEKKTEALQRLAVQPLHLRNANLSASASKSDLHSQSVNDTETKSGVYHHRHTQFPGRPQPLRQPNSSAKFFVPSKEQGNCTFFDTPI